MLIGLSAFQTVLKLGTLSGPVVVRITGASYRGGGSRVRGSQFSVERRRKIFKNVTMLLCQMRLLIFQLLFEKCPSKINKQTTKYFGFLSFATVHDDGFS